MDFNILKEELTKDPSKLGYQGDAQSITDLLNAKSIIKLSEVSISDVILWAAEQGAFDKLDAHLSDAAPIGNICKAANKMFGSVQSLNLGNQKIIDFLNFLVSAGVFKQEDADALINLAATKISRAEELGLQNVQAGDVEHALSI